MQITTALHFAARPLLQSIEPLVFFLWPVDDNTMPSASKLAGRTVLCTFACLLATVLLPACLFGIGVGGAVPGGLRHDDDASLSFALVVSLGNLFPLSACYYY